VDYYLKKTEWQMRHILIVFITILLCTVSLQAQMDSRGTDFWLAFGQNNGHTSTASLTFQVRVVAEQATTGSIYFTQLGTSVSFSVSAGGVYTYDLTAAERIAVYNTSGISNRTIRIQTNKPVTAYALNQASATTDATNVLPVTVFGTEYYHMGAKSAYARDAYGVIATANSTRVYHAGALIATLNEGEIYYHVAASGTVDMTGTRITADKPVAFFGMNQNPEVPPTMNGGDVSFQQLMPVNTWGKDYFIPVTTQRFEHIRIVASQDNTTITQTGGTIITNSGGQTTLNLNAGQWVQLEISLANNGCYIQADKPVQVGAYMLSNRDSRIMALGVGDAGITIVPSTEQTVTSALIAPFIPSGYTNLRDHYALIVTPTDTKNNTMVSIGGAAATALSGGTWYDNATSGMSFYIVKLTNSTTAYVYTNQAGLFVMGYGVGSAESYYYLASSAMRTLDVAFYVNNIHYQDLAFETICAQPAQIRAEISGNISTAPGFLKWYIDDAEETAAQDQLTWSKDFADGSYQIKMTVLMDDNVTTKTVEGTLVISCPVEPTVTVVEKTVCQNDTVHLVFTGVAPFDLDYTFNGTRQTITVFGMDTTLVATQAGKNIFAVHSLVSANGVSLSLGGVEIGGLIWATRNVDMPGTFAANPEDAGMLYQWNRGVGWSATNPAINSNGNTTWPTTSPTGNEWEEVNDPCPYGWRVPTLYESAGLNHGASQWTTTPVDGRIYGVAPNTIFLPAIAHRTSRDVLSTSYDFYYWSSTKYADAMPTYAWAASFNTAYSTPTSGFPRSYAACVRCVKESIQKEIITVHPIELDTVSVSICPNELPLIWRDTTFAAGTESGAFTFNRKSAAGCDSIVVLNLEVKGPIITQHETLTICGNELPYSWRDTVFLVGTESKQIIFERQTVGGCDSIVTLDLTVKPAPTVTVVEKTVCQNDTVHLVFTGIAPFELEYTFNDTRQTITVSGMDTALVATQTGENLFLVHRLVSSNGCFLLDLDDEDAVKINDVFWATRNVDAPGTFTQNPEDGGMFYQWNRTVGWSSTDPLVSSDGSAWTDTWVNDGATTWETANNVCPADYRVPTVYELENLASVAAQWTTINGINGRIFGSDDNTIFLPAAGQRFGTDSRLVSVGLTGLYWSATYMDRDAANAMHVFENSILVSVNVGIFCSSTLSVRCVKDVFQRDIITVNPIELDTVSVSICQDELPLIWRDTTFAAGTKSGAFIFNRQTAAGCDSIVVLNLEVKDCTTNPCENEPTVTVMEKIVCQNDTVHLVFTGVAPFELDYTFNGVRQSITVSGMDTALVATQVGENRFIVNSLISGNGCFLLGDGVEINGVIWATRNVDAPGTFTDNPEDFGMLYQWNRPIGWSSADPMINSNGGATWDNSYPAGTTWEEVNNVCPAGYRVPTDAEAQSLIDAGSWWTTQNGVNGRVFGSGGNTIFLPAVGSRYFDHGALNNTGLTGHYWVNTPLGSYSAYSLGIQDYRAFVGTASRHYAYSVRCVADFIQKVTVTPIEECTTPDPCENEPIITQHETLAICQNELPYNWRDTVFHVGTESKQIIFERQTVAGCDSIVTLDLIVRPMNYYTVQETICPNDSVYFYGKYYKETGLYYTDTLPPIVGPGCGTIVMLDLIVSSIHYENESLTICQNELPFTWRDTTFAVGTESGTFVFKKQISEGCDNIITLDLTVVPGVSVTVMERTVCQNDTVHLVFTGIAPFELDYTFNGTRQSITVSGMDTAFVATQTGNNLFLVHSLVSSNGCSLPNKDEDAVKINGVVWATCNVDAPGTFTQKPENAGMFYQWNSTVGWSSTNPPVSTDGSAWKLSWNGNDAPIWETTNDVCPADYRVPTQAELQSLVSAGSQWTTLNGVNGRIFGSVATIFLPAAGIRNTNSALISVGANGEYWSSTVNYHDTSHCLYFTNYSAPPVFSALRAFGFSVRCVKDVIQKDTIEVKDCTTLNPCENEPIITQHEALAICQNELPYSWRDTVFHVGTESKQIIFERKTVAGCDSIVTLDLMVRPINYYTVQETICPNDSVYFYGKYYKETGLYTDTLPPIWGLGCGTIVTLDLTVSSVHYKNESLTICQNELPFTWRDTTFAVGTESGTFVFNKQIAEGCNSITTLDLTVVPGVSVTVTERTVCQNDTVHLVFTGIAPFELDYTFNGTRQTITVSGMDTALIATQTGENLFLVHRLVSSGGCSLLDEEGVEINGVVWATRNVDAPRTFTQNPEDAGMFYQWNSTIGWSSTDPLVSTDGSPYNNSWGGNDARTWEADRNVCPAGWRIPTHPEQVSLVDAGSIWTTLNGTTGRIFGSGSNTIFLPYIGYRGRDGVLWLNHAPDVISADARYWSDTRLSGSGDELINGAHVIEFHRYSAVATSGYGTMMSICAVSVRCVKEAIQQDTITVNPIAFNTVSMTICPDESVLFNHKYYSQTGIYTDTLTAISGCDSIVTLDLTVRQDNYSYTIRDAVCQGQDYKLYNFDLTNVQSSTTETQYLTTVFCGSDSIVTLELSVNPVYNDTIRATICQGQNYNSYNFNLTNVQNSTTEIQYLQTVFGGCDSIVRLELTVNPASYDAIYATICQGQDYKLHNFNLTNVQHSIMTSQYWTTTLGCDSIIALYLTVNPLDITRIDKTISVGEGYNENGFTIPVQNADTTISETLHLKNQNLCDSTVILTLNVVSCVPDMVPIFDSICAGELYYFDNKLLSASGIYFESGINSEGCDSVTVLDFKVLPKYHNDIYEEIIIGEAYIFNGRTYRESGVYNERFVAVSDCDSTVTLYLKVVPRCPEIEIPTYFSPNSDGINDYWKIKNIECYSYYKITLCDRFGKKLYVWENNFPGWDGTYLGKPMPSTDYWYVITLEEVQGSYVGHFTLMR